MKAATIHNLTLVNKVEGATYVQWSVYCTHKIPLIFHYYMYPVASLVPGLSCTLLESLACNLIVHGLGPLQRLLHFL